MAVSLQGVGVSLIEGTGAAQPGQMGVLWSLIGANMASTADQPFVPAGFPFQRFIINQIVVTQASGSLSGAIGGIYTGAGKTGTILVAASQIYSGVTGTTSVLTLTLTAVATALLTSSSAYLSLTTALGSAATANFYVIGMAL